MGQLIILNNDVLVEAGHRRRLWWSAKVITARSGLPLLPIDAALVGVALGRWVAISAGDVEARPLAVRSLATTGYAHDLSSARTLRDVMKLLPQPQRKKESPMLKSTATLLACLVLAGSSGCALAQKPIACSALRDGAFAVASYGCLKIQEPVARDACTKAGLAASILAYQACMKEAGTATTVVEIGDPIEGADAAAVADAQAIILEYRALNDPSQLPWYAGGGGKR